MDKSDEEKDLYIKSKIKDGHIPEKIDNLFNNRKCTVCGMEEYKTSQNITIKSW